MAGGRRIPIRASQKIVTLNYLENSLYTRSYIDPNKYYLVLSCRTDYFLGHHASAGERISHHALSLTWQYLNPFE